VKTAIWNALQQTQAQISNAEQGYDYRLALAILRYQTTGI